MSFSLSLFIQLSNFVIFVQQNLTNNYNNFAFFFEFCILKYLRHNFGNVLFKIKEYPVFLGETLKENKQPTVLELCFVTYDVSLLLLNHEAHI
jgi:hypothetical protein